MNNKKIALCDLLMCWPPDAGAFVDVVNIASFLSKHARVILIVPKIDNFFKNRTTIFDSILRKYTRFFMRGYIEGNLPFEIIHIPFSAAEFRPSVIAERYDRVLSEFQPDKTFITNGWHLKAHLARALKKYKPILRIYAHESLCTKADGWFFRRNQLCENNYLSGVFFDYLKCLTCTTSFYVGYPAVRWVQEYIMSGAYRRNYIDVVKDGLNASSTVITYNEWTAERIRPYNSNVQIIPSGVDCDRFYPLENDRDNQTFTVLTTGRVIERHKGRDFLIAVARRLQNKYPNILFLVTGTKVGFKETNIKEVGWFSQEDLPKLYHKADMVFIPSLWPEPQGIVAVEAWASGLPLLASNVGGLKDMVQDGINGFLVEPFDTDKAVGYIIELYNDRVLRKKLGDNGRRWAMERFKWENIFHKYYVPLFLS